MKVPHIGISTLFIYFLFMSLFQKIYVQSYFNLHLSIFCLFVLFSLVLLTSGILQVWCIGGVFHLLLLSDFHYKEETYPIRVFDMLGLCKEQAGLGPGRERGEGGLSWERWGFEGGAKFLAGSWGGLVSPTTRVGLFHFKFSFFFITSVIDSFLSTDVIVLIPHYSKVWACWIIIKAWIPSGSLGFSRLSRKLWWWKALCFWTLNKKYREQE